MFATVGRPRRSLIRSVGIGALWPLRRPVRSAAMRATLAGLRIASCGAWLATLVAGPAMAQPQASTTPPPELRWRTEVVARGLAHPWGVTFLPQGRFLVTERGGTLRVVQPDGKVSEPLSGVPAVAATGQGGLLDVLADRGFAGNRTIYLCYSEPASAVADAAAGSASGSSGRSTGSGTALARATLSDDLRALQGLTVIFRQQPKMGGGLHFGCRIVEAADGTLFLSLGDRGTRMDDAQNLATHIGKVVRITKDGKPPADNPFIAQAGALPEIWSYGHRNLQGATLGPDGALWTHEHGPQGGDEINRPQAGRNHGWPVITYGERYGGGPVGEGITAKPGMEQPLLYWRPSIAPSGMAFISSDRYPGARGHLLVGALRSGEVRRIEWAGTRVVAEQRVRIGARVRDVKQGPDGWVYLLTDKPDGELLRLLP